VTIILFPSTLRGDPVWDQTTQERFRKTADQPTIADEATIRELTHLAHVKKLLAVAFKAVGRSVRSEYGPR